MMFKSYKNNNNKLFCILNFTAGVKYYYYYQIHNLYTNNFNYCDLFLAYIIGSVSLYHQRNTNIEWFLYGEIDFGNNRYNTFKFRMFLFLHPIISTLINHVINSSSIPLANRCIEKIPTPNYHNIIREHTVTKAVV